MMMRRRSSVLECSDESVHLIVSPSGAGCTFVVSIDRYTGQLCHRGERGVDVFADHESAQDAANRGVFGVPRSVRPVEAILGYLILGGSGHLLVAERVTPTVDLFGGHQIFTVQQTSWWQIPLLFPSSPSLFEDERLSLLKEVVVAQLHYYCDTLDVTRPFPSAHSQRSPRVEFSWNEFLAAPFAEIGLRECCPILVHGQAEDQAVVLGGGAAAFNIALLTRREAARAGSRFFACGLDADGEACGNEVECELIVWRTAPATAAHASEGEGEKDEGDTWVRWAAMLWRVGSPPIQCSVPLPAAGSGEEDAVLVHVRQREETGAAATATAAATYFQRLVEGSMCSKVVIVDLNRQQRGELEATELLFSSVESVKRQLQLDLTFVNVDWFGLASEVGTLGAANGLLGLVRDARSSPSSSPPSPFSTGSAWICRLPPDASDSSGATPTPRRHSLTLSDAPTSPPAFFAVDSLSSQGSLVRFSSVESFFSQMDASFFVVMEQLPAMLKHIGVGRELLQGGNALVRRGGSDADDVIGGSVTGSFSGTNVNGVNNAAGNAASSSGLVGHLESLLGSAVLLPASQLFILAAHTIELAYGSGEAALPPAPDAFVDATQMQPAPGAPSGVGGSGSGGAPDVSDISPAQSMRFSVVRATGLFFGSSSSSSNEDQLRKAAAQREKERRALEGVLSGPPAFHPLPCRLMQRYHDGARPRGLAAILKTVGTSRLTPSRWAPIAAFEIARQNALDMFLGRNLQRHLPVTLRGGRGGRGSWSALQRVVQRVDAVPVAALHGGTAAVVAAAATLTTKERSLSIGVGGAPRASPLLAPLPLLGGASASYAVVASPLCTATLSAASDEYEAVALESRWPSSLLALFSGAPAAAAGPLWEHDVTGADVEVTLALSSPCRLALVALTVQWTSTDLSAPQSVEVWAGATLDAMRPRLQGVTLPRVAPGTQLVYAVDAESALKRPLDFYDFYADEGAAAEEEAVRFVRVALSGVPAGVRMTVGAIDLYGAPVDCADERLGALASIEEHGVSKLTANALRMIESGGSVGMEGGNSVVGRLRAASLAGGRTASSLSSSGYEAMGRRIRAEVTYLQQASVLLKDGSGAGGGFGESVSLLDALSLDETRLRLNLSVATRDNLLATIGAGAVAAVDPNRHVYPRDPRLAAPPASTRGNVCQRQECTQPLAANMDRCRRCTRTLCRACMAASPVTRRGSQSGGTPIVAGQSGVGSPLLASGQLGGQSMQPGGTPMLAAAAAPLPPAECRIPEFCWTQTVPVCPDCHRTLVQQESLLARIVALKGEFDPDDAAAAADDARFAAAARARQYDVSNDVAGIVRPLDLAVAASVPHDRFSAPISAALISDTGRPRGLQWFYVGDVGSGGSGSPVHIVLVLLRSYRVRGVRLTADRLGIARQDAPGVRVEATVGGDASSLALLADHASLLTLYQSQGGAADSHASTGIPPNHVVDVAWSRVVVPRYVIVTLTPPASGLLHLGGIALLGEPLPSARASLAVPRTLFSPRDTAPEQQVQASVRVERAPVKVAWARHRPGRTRVDIGVEPFRMSGVALTPRAYEGRRDSQVREVRVLEAVVNQKGDLVSEAAIIASLVVPRVPSGTTLFFDHVAEIRGNVVSIECLDNYGEREMCPLGGVFLY